jgi:hypothetical protein
MFNQFITAKGTRRCQQSLNPDPVSLGVLEKQQKGSQAVAPNLHSRQHRSPDVIKHFECSIACSMASDLSQLLLEFTQHAAPLAHTESLEDFKQQARGVCRDVQFTPQQLNAVRGQLHALGSSSWQQLGVDGVVAADVAR